MDRRAVRAAAAPYALRATQHQSIPPESQFTWLPYALITADGVVVTQGPVPAIFPGPLLPNLQGAPISEAGYDRVVERARALGLLDGDGDFTPPEPMPGSLSGLIELRVDGSMRQITGDPNRTIECITTPCDPAPGIAGGVRHVLAGARGPALAGRRRARQRTLPITPRAMRC